MPSKDTVPAKLTINTINYLNEWKKKISLALGIEESGITLKQAEIAMRETAKKGKLPIEILKDILLGKIKWNFQANLGIENNLLQKEFNQNIHVNIVEGDIKWIGH